MSDAGQSFPSSSRPDDTDYGTCELESIARRPIGNLSGGRVFEAAESDHPGCSRATVQSGLGAGRSNNYPSESARTLLKECFADNPPVQLDPHQQLTGMSSNQMIQNAGAIGLEVSLATFGMLEDVLLKIGGKTGRNVGEKWSGQSVSLSRSGSTVMESVASRSFYSLSTITESFDSDRVTADLSQQPCSSRQADAALDFSRTEVTKINDTDSLKRLGQVRSDAGKSVICIGGQGKVGRNQFRPVGWMAVDMLPLRRCWRSPLLRKSLLLVLKIRWNIGIVFTAWFVGETCQWNLGACMHWSDTSNGSIIWGQIRGFVPGIILRNYVGQMGVLCTGPSWKLRRSCLCIWMYQNWIINVFSTMMSLKGSRLLSRRQVRGLWYELSCCWFFWDEEANCGHSKDTGPKCECWRFILRGPLTSIGVRAIFLKVYEHMFVLVINA